MGLIAALFINKEVRMNHIFKRLTALLLCLCLLAPCLALAEDAHGIRFTLDADMDPDAYPVQDQPLMQGLSELINMITLEGVFQYDEDCIDLDADLLLDGDEKTRTGVRIYGNEAYWGIQSSLFGQEELSLNLQALLEFCMKAYFHLEVPLQRVGLFVTPYVHKDGLGAITSLWNRVMHAEQGSRVIAREDVLTLAHQISSVSATDRAFTYWVQALALEAGYDGVINDFMSVLPEWADEFLGDEGIVITVDGDNETWTSGGATLFSRTVKDGWTTLSLALPMTTDGYLLSGFCTTKDNATNFDADIRLSVTQEGMNILDLRFSTDNLPKVIPANGDFTLTYDVTGDAMPDGFHLLFEGTSTDGVFSIQQKDAKTGITMLTISGTAVSAEVTSPLDWTGADLTGLEFFSLSDVTLSQFVKDVQAPLLKGMLPLLVHAPMAACQSLMDLATDTGIFDVLTSSASDMDVADEEFFGDEDEWADESWDEEDWDEESWDEESWDEEDWDEESFDEENWDDIDWDDDSLYE